MVVYLTASEKNVLKYYYAVLKSTKLNYTAVGHRDEEAVTISNASGDR